MEIFPCHRWGNWYNSPILHILLITFSIIDFFLTDTLSSVSTTITSLTFVQINQATHDQALVLQNALQNIPNPASECMLRNVAIRLAQQISDEVTENISIQFKHQIDLYRRVGWSGKEMHVQIKGENSFFPFLFPNSPLELFPGIKVHPRYMCDSCSSENSVGVRLRYNTARLQFKWRN